uniref:Uncharacterized protein n=1 Tax=Anguilla anguilla TaxID=7936 RepID=A0A0E9PYT0_ANGAN
MKQILLPVLHVVIPLFKCNIKFNFS